MLRDNIKIKLIGNDEDKSRAFYVLLNEGSIFSDSLDIFYVNNKHIELLDKEKCLYEILV